MPFKSEKQRRFLWAEHPELAKRWAHEYPESNKGLPMYANDKKDAEKKAALHSLAAAIATFSGNGAYLTGNANTPSFSKESLDSLMRVEIPHSDKPTYAGQEREQGEQKLDENKDEPAAPSDREKCDENGAKEMLAKISAVLAQPYREQLEAQQAQAEGREPRFVPNNMGLKRYSIPSPYITPPMGMGAPPPNASAAQGAQAAQQNMPQPSNSPVGGGSNPQHNPIQAFGPLGAKGQLNGNAAFGQKNSPDSIKTAMRGDMFRKALNSGALNFVSGIAGDVPARATWTMGSGGALRADSHAQFMADLLRRARGGMAKVRPKLPYGGPIGGTMSGAAASQAGALARAAGGAVAKLASAAPAKTAGLKDIFGSGEKMPGWYGAESLVEVPGGGYRYGHTHGVDVVDSKPGWLRRIFDRDPYVLREDVPKYKRKLKAIRGMHVMEQPNRLEFSHMGQLKPEMRQLIEAALAKQASRNDALAEFMGIENTDLPDPRDQDDEEIDRSKSAGDSPAWQRSEGKNPEGGLNAKGRASYKRETGGTLKAPVTESNPSGERAKRQNSFCSRMCGMKRVNTGAKTKSDPDSRINKALRKWNCKCGSARDLLTIVAADTEKEAFLGDLYRRATDPIRKKINDAIRKAVLAAGIGGAAVGGVTGGLAGSATAPATQPARPAAVQMAEQAAQAVKQQQPLRLTAKDINAPAAAAQAAVRAPKPQPVTPAVIHAPGPVYQGVPALRAQAGVPGAPEIKAAPEAVKKQVAEMLKAKDLKAALPGAAPSSPVTLPGKNPTGLGAAAALTALGSGLGAYQAPKGHKTEGATRGGIRGAVTGLGGLGGAALASLASAHPLARLGGGLAGAGLGYGGSGVVLGKPSWQQAQA